MSLILDPRGHEFGAFSARVTHPDTLATLCRAADTSLAEVERHTRMALAESAQTLAVLRGLEVPVGARILEVGAGLGVTSNFLASQGASVIALEPGGGGFEAHARLSVSLAAVLQTGLELRNDPVESLTPERDGRFDLIYSNNVLEHVADPIDALRVLQALVDSRGVSVHSCPNYVVPFEPHFGIPLVPLRPASTARLLPQRVRGSGLWQSLNFVTSADVRTTASHLGCEVIFRPGVLAASLRRLDDDAEFRRRHPALGRLGSLLTRFRIPDAAARLPATWSTPMDFALLGPERSADTLNAWRRALLGRGDPEWPPLTG